MMLVIWYTAGVVLLHFIEVAVNALSGEANRLTLYLVAPLALTRFLCAKLLLFLLPALVEGVVIGLFLSWRLGLMLSQIGFVLITVALMVVATITLLVLGSAWDEDLNVAVEGFAQAVMQEEMPITPRRMWLLNFSVLLFALLFLLVWKASNGVSVISLIMIDGVIVIGMLRFSHCQIQRLLLKG